MAARAIASLSLSFGLVSIPVKLYSATDTSTAIRFKLMARGGAAVRQQYVAEPEPDDPAFDDDEVPSPMGSGLQQPVTGSGLQQPVTGSGLQQALTGSGLHRPSSAT